MTPMSCGLLNVEHEGNCLRLAVVTHFVDSRTGPEISGSYRLMVTVAVQLSRKSWFLWPCRVMSCQLGAIALEVGRPGWTSSNGSDGSR